MRWNLIGYLKFEPVSAEIILTDLVEQEDLIIAKDENGSCLSSSMGILMV